MSKRTIEEVDLASLNDKNDIKKLKIGQEQNEIESDDDEIDIEINDELMNQVDEEAKEFTFVDQEDTNYDDSGDSDGEDDKVGSDDELEHRENLREIKEIHNGMNSPCDELLEETTELVEIVNENGETLSIQRSEIVKSTVTKHLDENSPSPESEGEELTEDENIEIAAKSFIYKYIQDKKDEGVPPLEFALQLGFKLEIELESAWKVITAFLTRRKIAVMLFLNYLKYNSFIKPYRKSLGTVNNFEDVLNLFNRCNNIVIITGAGVSVSSGIPDFRSKGGIYETIEKKYNLPRPESLFDINYLRQDPRPFFEFAKEIYPGVHKPTPTHHFIKKLDQMGKLLRNYTQNIDTLEHVVGIDSEKLVNCHGSFSTATCIKCQRKVSGDEIRDVIMKMEIPHCEVCNDQQSFMKPDIVFFGENLPERFDQCVSQDMHRVDLIIVMGSSLQVQPVALLPDTFDKSIPQILVNRERVAQPHEFDYYYLGDCDNFVNELTSKIGWDKDK